MKSSKYSNLFYGLIFCLCNPSFTYGANFSQLSFLSKRVYLGFEVTAFVPYGQILGPSLLKKKLSIDSKFNSGWQVGTVLGYDFLIDSSSAIRPEIGLRIGRKRQCELLIPDNARPYDPDNDFAGMVSGILVQERCWYIPLSLHWIKVNPETGRHQGSLVLGYEFYVLRSSHFRQSSGPQNDRTQSILERLEKTANAMKLGGSVAIGGRVNIFKDICYFEGRLKLPIVDIRFAMGGWRDQDMEKFSVGAARSCLASSLDMSIGINIMKWLQYIS